MVIPIPTLPLPDTNKADATEGEDTCNKLALFAPLTCNLAFDYVIPIPTLPTDVILILSVTNEPL